MISLSPCRGKLHLCPSSNTKENVYPLFQEVAPQNMRLPLKDWAGTSDLRPQCFLSSVHSLVASGYTTYTTLLKQQIGRIIGRS